MESAFSGAGTVDPTLRFAVESIAAASADHGSGGAVLTFIGDQGQNDSEYLGGIGSYIPPPYNSACSLGLGKNKLIVSDVRAYFGRTFLTGDSKQFDPPSNGKTRYILARFIHPSDDNIKLSVVAVDKMNDAKNDLSTTYRLLYEVSLSGGNWDSGKSRVTVLDCRYMPQIPAYT